MSYGIEWLIVDKFIDDKEERNILCDALGDRMSLIYEYVNRREQKGRYEGMKEGKKEIISSLIESGTPLQKSHKKPANPSTNSRKSLKIKFLLRIFLIETHAIF